MLIVCPTCASTNSVKTVAADLSAADAPCEELRCDSCGSQWFERAPSETTQAIVQINAEAISSHALRPARRKFSTGPVVIKAPPPPRPARSALYTSLTLLALVTGLSLSVAKREVLVRQVPQTASLFRVIGLPVNLRGLAFKDVKTKIFEDNGQRVLAVEGTITSLAKSSANVPPMRVSLRGEDGREIYSWTAQPSQPKLEPGATLLFRTRLASPPTNAQVAYVNFTNADGTVLR